jgi:S-adenosylmethionine:tRNA ribosyltransferase-isomerase
MLVSDFNYHLPPESIAQEPRDDRAASRLLHLVRQAPTNSPWHDRSFRDFPDLLRPDDLLVLNNTRVFPARLFGHRSGQRAQPLSPHNPASRDFLHGSVEVLLTRQISEEPNEWECLVRPGRKIGVGEKLFFRANSTAFFVPSTVAEFDSELVAEVIARGAFGERHIRFSPVPDFFSRVERLGHVPLPPYIDREDRPADRDRYQTVYAKSRGSVAAPTAGLHFTPEIFDRIRARGIEIAEITLHVGLGTFQPVRVEKVENHKLHRESFEISPAAATAINIAKAQGRRIVAVGTTTVRTLEFAAAQSEECSVAAQSEEPSAVPQPRATTTAAQQQASTGVRADSSQPTDAPSSPPTVHPGRGEADIFIYPGYRFRLVDALLTNFHLPQSTLLMLVSAFAGRDPILAAYRHAVSAGYRFYSYGDCMFIE